MTLMHIKLNIQAVTRTQQYDESKGKPLWVRFCLQTVFLPPKSTEKNIYIFFAGILQILFQFEGLRKCYI